MASQESSLRASDGPAAIRRTRSANDMDTLSLDSPPMAARPTSQGPPPLQVDITEASSTTVVQIVDGENSQTSFAPNRIPTPASPADHPPPVVPPAATGASNTAPAAATNTPLLAGGSIRQFFSRMGIGRGAPPDKKARMSLIWNLAWGFAQVVTISVLAALSGTKWKSPLDPSQTEWQACDRPLGVWACLWAARVVLASGMAIWGYKRTQARTALRAAHTSRPTDGSTTSDQTVGGLYPLQNTNDTTTVATNNDPNNPNSNDIYLPHTVLYSRLGMFSSLLTLSWFLTAHILQYTSLKTCRYTSPHLWWLTFGILCIMYLMILEVLLLGFIVLIVGPILFVFWNIFLFCIGHHPAQNPQVIKPDIGKLPKALVDRIPLVMYIPPPPGAEVGTDKPETEGTPAAPTSPHSYPPTSPSTAGQQATATPTAAPTPKRNRFKFFKRKSTKEEGTDPANGDPTAVDLEKGKVEQETWEGSFEKSEYPFVVLDGNRAACAICLMDFEAPRKIEEGQLQVPSAAAPASSSSTPTPQQTGGEAESSDSALKLTDSGEGAQPLRLLACGHVFHQTCLDPWLTDVSGRCPVCQRPVEVSELKKRKRGRR